MSLTVVDLDDALSKWVNQLAARFEIDPDTFVRLAITRGCVEYSKVDKLYSEDDTVSLTAA